MSNWGISPNASEKEKIKADYADELHGLNSVGTIPYDVYSDLFDLGMDLFDKMYEQGKADAVKHGRWVKNDYSQTVCSRCRHPIPGYWGMYEGCPDGVWTEIEPTQYCPNCGAKMEGGE